MSEFKEQNTWLLTITVDFYRNVTFSPIFLFFHVCPKIHKQILNSSKKFWNKMVHLKTFTIKVEYYENEKYFSDWIAIYGRDCYHRKLLFAK